MTDQKMRETVTAHWLWLERLLTILCVSGNTKGIMEFVYKSAFEHGWKHALEQKCDDKERFCK